MTIMFTLSIIIAVGCILIFIISTYNRFQDYIIRINEAEVSIDSVLRKRFDLLSKSIGVIKANTDIEGDVLEIIAKLRSKKLDNFELDRGLYEAINEFNTYKENYENLRNCESYMMIEINLIESESEIVALRKYYNDIITDYNKMVKSCPSNFVALLKKYKTKAYFDGNSIETDNETIRL